MKRVRIAGTGSAVPPRVLANAELARMVDTSNEWIVERTGIRERRIADPGVAASDLGAEASRRALESAGVRPEEIDLIVCATSNPDRFLPSTACYIQAKIGAFNAGAVDMLAACTGYVYALTTGWRYAQSGAYKNVLVVGAEVLSKITDFTDRTTCVIFGDGAGAAILQPHDDAKSDILYSKLCADGRLDDYIIVPGGGGQIPASVESVQARRHFIRMKGRETYKFAVTKMTELTQEALKAIGATVNDVALLVPHQVNLRIIESSAERIGMPMDRIFINIDRYGNTSAASVPLALDEAVRAGRIKRGDLIVIVAFGGGLTWGSIALRW